MKVDWVRQDGPESLRGKEMQGFQVEGCSEQRSGSAQPKVWEDRFEQGMARQSGI